MNVLGNRGIRAQSMPTGSIQKPQRSTLVYFWFVLFFLLLVVLDHSTEHSRLDKSTYCAAQQLLTFASRTNGQTSGILRTLPAYKLSLSR